MTKTPKQNTDNSSNNPKSPGFWSTVKSVMGAMIGVQSEAQRKEDFEKADPVKIILGGIIFTLVFIFTLIYFANKVLESGA